MLMKQKQYIKKKFFYYIIKIPGTRLLLKNKKKN